jgi:quercetin dioxygenase-like cupin family protein
VKRIFSPENFITVADGTEVSAFLNATDTSLGGLRPDLLEGASIAAGRIAAGKKSWVHTHPAVTQVIYVVAGNLIVRMKDPQAAEPYRLEVTARSAVVSEPGTLLQLHNESAHNVEVLYVVTPSYVFEVGEDGEVVHDDSILVAEDWSELGAEDWDAYATESVKLAARTRRCEALARLAAADR